MTLDDCVGKLLVGVNEVSRFFIELEFHDGTNVYVTPRTAELTESWLSVEVEKNEKTYRV